MKDRSAGAGCARSPTENDIEPSAGGVKKYLFGGISGGNGITDCCGRTGIYLVAVDDTNLPLAGRIIAEHIQPFARVRCGHGNDRIGHRHSAADFRESYRCFLDEKQMHGLGVGSYEQT